MLAMYFSPPSSSIQDEPAAVRDNFPPPLYAISSHIYRLKTAATIIKLKYNSLWKKLFPEDHNFFCQENGAMGAASLEEK